MKKLRTPLFLLLICLSIHFFGTESESVERFYSGSFFVWLSAFLRRLTGFFPFSLGDILYGFVLLWLTFKLYIFAKNTIQKNGAFSKEKFFLRLRVYFIWVACIYILFSVFWGLNYGRPGIDRQLGLNVKKYDRRQLIRLNEILLRQVNESKQVLVKNKIFCPDDRILFARAGAAYEGLTRRYSFMNYSNPSIKSSLWGWFGNYAGFTGYYNPLTAEAQVNTTVPDFLRPFISCHEVAHQLGYAKEMEANFVGFLAATASSDTLFQYSAYLEMFLYANRNLQRIDSLSSKGYRDQLADPVKKDILSLVQFNREHKSFLEPVVSWFYDKFLLSNRQPKGILSYSEVVGYLIAYYGID